MTEYLHEKALETLKACIKDCHPFMVDEDPVKPSYMKGKQCERCYSKMSVFYWPLTVGINERYMCDKCALEFLKWWDTPHKRL